MGKTFIKNISPAQVAIEFVSVVFAVLLALGLNSWKENKANEEAALLLKSNILDELKKNQSLIDLTLENNKEYFSYLDSIITVPRAEVQGIYFEFNYENLTNGAWVIAQNSPAIHNLDSEFLKEVADIYQAQIFYDEFARQFFQNVSQLVSQIEIIPDGNLAISVYYSINVMRSSATDLQADYKEILEKHDTP